jgi:hypothetical protein
MGMTVTVQRRDEVEMRAQEIRIASVVRPPLSSCSACLPAYRASLANLICSF